ncbi:hypothetical protein ZHAS_00004533 [Anopheles sinensis]|uniref:Uncharacterized protein n=1 Tax=Anopheles sinensis TaxID=74873 RepID=A0A084VHF8_ANOSI|nr:hypothetical protein ZHAS_00004533 [Anopheles sinensis]
MQMGEMTDYDCDLEKTAWVLNPLAHIPGGGSTMNPFHNPYPPLDCVYITFYCRKDSFILGDLHIEPHVRNGVCPGFNILLAKGSWKVQLATNPGSKECQTAERWFSLDLFVYRQNDYIFMYGCHQASENLPVRVGAWVLVDANATQAKRERILEMTRRLALKIPGFRDEWWSFPPLVSSNRKCYGNWTCDYLANCVTSKDQDVLANVTHESETAEMVYMVVGPLLFVTVIVLARMVYKHIQSNKVGPTQPSPQVDPVNE